MTFISDTHSYHKRITSSLPGGDILIHCGDISSMGYIHEVEIFCNWFDKLDNYDHKVFIAGNHDWLFQKSPENASEIVNSYKWINYLQDNWIIIDNIKIWGSPWVPFFFNWAFNLGRDSKELEEKRNLIPNDTDILITHGPAYGYVDRVVGEYENLGCKLLTKRIKEIKPKIHVCGDIHTGYGYVYDKDTHFINASVLDERYVYSQKPLTADWNKENNELIFI